LPPDMLESHKDSKDSDDSLVSTKNMRQNIGPLDWHPEPGNVGPKTSPLVTPPKRTPNPKLKFFFS